MWLITWILGANGFGPGPAAAGGALRSAAPRLRGNQACSKLVILSVHLNLLPHMSFSSTAGPLSAGPSTNPPIWLHLGPQSLPKSPSISTSIFALLFDPFWLPKWLQNHPKIMQKSSPKRTPFLIPFLHRFCCRNSPPQNSKTYVFL